MTKHLPQKRFVIAVLWSFLSCQPVWAFPSISRSDRAKELIDFKSQDFTCSREEDHVPTPTPEAEALFQRAYQTHMKATSGKNTNELLLREALKGYREAADAGHWKAVRNLANLAVAGVEDSKKVYMRPNPEKAVQYAQQLIDMNVATGYNLMAAFASRGWGVRQDEKAALMYERRAADLGHARAQRHLGRKFLLQFNDLPSAEREQMRAIGRKMLACAVRQGDREAASDLATEYEVGVKNYPHALFYYQQAGKMGDASSLFALEEWFHEGQHGYRADSTRAERYHAYAKRAGRIGEGPFPELDKDAPLPPPPNGGSYPSPEAGWPNEWTRIKN